MTTHSPSVSFYLPESEETQRQKLERRQALATQLQGSDFPDLFDVGFDVEQVGKKNCENLLGSVEVPVGVAGPVKVRGDVLSEEVLLPLATTEGALVASIQRGCKVMNACGGAQVVVRKVGMSRAPVFRCKNGHAAMTFCEDLSTHVKEFATECEKTSTHLKFLSHQTWVQGRFVFVRFVFDTGEAMGMNMVSIAIQSAWENMKAHFEDVEMVSLSGNMCADKKESSINQIFGRGYWVQAELEISEEVVRTVLKTTSQAFFETHHAKNLVGSNLAGSHSQNMHVGNAVAATYLATGQDMAHVTEGSQANTTVEKTEHGLYVAVTLPNIVVGTVGGGTWLPSQSQARQVIRKGQQISALQLAGVVGVAALAGEISGIAALSTHSLAQAHQRLGRSQSSEG